MISYNIYHIKNSIMQIILLQYERVNFTLYNNKNYVLAKSNNNAEERIKLSEKHRYPVVCHSQTNKWYRVCQKMEWRQTEIRWMSNFMKAGLQMMEELFNMFK